MYTLLERGTGTWAIQLNGDDVIWYPDQANALLALAWYQANVPPGEAAVAAVMRAQGVISTNPNI